MENNYFNELNKININDKTDKKGKFTYLSWAWAWGEVKKLYPEASYNIHKFGEDKKPYLLDRDLGYMVFTDVTINGITHEMWLPLMDFKNQAIQEGKATMMEVNKAIMRCLVKNIGMHGLGLYIYAGEDLPDEEDGKSKSNKSSDSKEDLKTDKEYKNLINLLMNEQVTTLGSNEAVYNAMGMTEERFKNGYKTFPRSLYEHMQKTLC